MAQLTRFTVARFLGRYKSPPLTRILVPGIKVRAGTVLVILPEDEEQLREQERTEESGFGPGERWHITKHE